MIVHKERAVIPYGEATPVSKQATNLREQNVHRATNVHPATSASAGLACRSVGIAMTLRWNIAAM